MLSTDMRKPAVKNLNEVLEREYTIITFDWITEILGAYEAFGNDSR